MYFPSLNAFLPSALVSLLVLQIDLSYLESSPGNQTLTNLTTISWTVSPAEYCLCNGAKSCPRDSLHVKLLCHQPQSYVIILQGDSDGSPVYEQQTFEIRHCQDLYRWYAIPVTDIRSTTPAFATKDEKWQSENMTVRVWIGATEYMSAEERNGESSTPSKKSAHVTGIFQEMGLVPRMRTNFSDQRDIFFHCSNYTSPVYTADTHFWTFSCPRTKNDRYGIDRQGLLPCFLNIDCLYAFFEV